MVKRTQTIRRQFAYELFECVWLFRGVDAFKGFYASHDFYTIVTIYPKDVFRRNYKTCGGIYN